MLSTIIYCKLMLILSQVDNGIDLLIMQIDIIQTQIRLLCITWY